MNSKLRKAILNLVPKSISNFIFYNHPQYKKLINGSLSYSQEGEDMVLKRLFSNIPTGTYVDVGAHHPSLFSNTNHFYQQGWTGINIDGLPGSQALFDIERPKDVNLELLVSETEEMTDFYLFNPSLMNTMSKEQAVLNAKFDWCRPLGTTQVKVMPLQKILDTHLLPGTKINFMSIDVEGAEMGVLRSNNWSKYRPDVIVIEVIDIDFEEIKQNGVYQFLSLLNYNFFAKTGNSLFFKTAGFFEF
jgi:FkbM family methyltransferase